MYYVPRYVPHYNSGDSVMAHHIVKYLLEIGHDVTVMTKGQPYEYDGVTVTQRNPGMLKAADVVLCQLDTTKEAIVFAKCAVFVMHNTFAFPSVSENLNVGVIFNSKASIKETGWLNDGCVLTPPVGEEYTVSRGTKITLINCNENKGGKIFHEIAKRLPEYDFLQVKGAYGEQFLAQDYNKGARVNLDNSATETGIGSLPNVEVWEHQEDIRDVYKQTRILLMPSLYESWGKVATEAMMSGIPVICTPTFGLKENCGENGIFVERDNIDGWVMAIKKLSGKKEYEKASAYAKKQSRSHNSKQQLSEMNQWLTGFVHKKKQEYGIQ